MYSYKLHSRSCIKVKSWLLLFSGELDSRKLVFACLFRFDSIVVQLAGCAEIVILKLICIRLFDVVPFSEDIYVIHGLGVVLHFQLGL